MNFRSIFISVCCLSFVLLVRGEYAPAAAPASQSLATVSAPEKATAAPAVTAPKPANLEYAAAFAKLFKTERPLALREELGIFDAKPVEEVRVFESMAAFEAYLKKHRETIAVIGDFKNYIKPDDEPKFRGVLRAHAAKSGADYLVMVTDEKELAKNFKIEPECPLVYGAIAYKRAEARLGIVPAKEASEKGHTKVAGFMKGSLAKKGGLREGDLITKVDGNALDRSGYWRKALRWKAGERVKVEVERDGKIMEFEVELMAG